MPLAVETHQLCKRFRNGRLAVSSLDLAVPPGSVTGLVGPNGAGKTTTLRLLLGLLRPTSGQIRLFGEDPRASGLSALSRVGAIIEGPTAYPYLTGYENLQVLADTGPGAPAQQLRRVLDEVGLGQRADEPVRTYSHGMRQRLAIGGALLNDPDLLILDEPFEGLDPRGMDDLRELVTRRARDSGTAVIISTHLLGEVESACDRVIVLEQGRLLASGDLAELLASDLLAVEVAAQPRARAEEVIEGLEFARRHAGENGQPRDETLLSVQVPAGREADLNSALIAAGVEVTALIPRPRSLASLFRELTGGRSADRGEP